MNDAPICLAVCHATGEVIVAGLLLFVVFMFGYWAGHKEPPERRWADDE